MPREKLDMFIVFGMPRAGTTYLYFMLSRHPSIFVPYRKESHYFSVNFHKGHDWFRSLYEDRRPGELAADINPVYYLDDRAIQRVLDFNPDVRVLLSVREPVDFAVSLYRNMVTQKYPVSRIQEVVKAYSWNISSKDSLDFSLADNFMERRVGELATAFGDNLLIYDFRVFNESPLGILNAIEDFLGIPRFFDEGTYENVRINASGRRSSSLINTVITNQKILDAAYALTPKRFVRWARRAFERFSAAGSSNDDSRLAVSDSEIEALRALLSSDRDFYGRLFAAKPILRGSELGDIEGRAPLASNQ